jgi:membrane-associated protein
MGSVEWALRVLASHPFQVVFFASLIEAAGIPFPSRVILVLTPAFLVTRHEWLTIVAVAVAGALIGDHVPYIAGRFAGMRMLGLYCRLTLGSDACVEKTLRLFHRFHSWAILGSRFSASVRLFASACAGCSRMTYPRYLALDAAGTIVYTVVFVLIGFLVGDRAVEFLTKDRRRWLFFGVVATAFATLMLYRIVRRLRHGRARAAKLEALRPS